MARAWGYGRLLNCRSLFRSLSRIALIRILHVVPTYFPAIRYGGPIRSVRGLAAATAALGHDVHVFTTNVDGSDDLEVPTDRPVTLDGVSVRYFAAGLGRRLFRSPAMAAALRAEVASFDVLHIHYVWVWPTTAAARAARRMGVPYVLAPRGMLVRDLIRRKSRVVKNVWIRLLERSNVEQAAAIHVTTDAEAEKLAEMALSPKRVVLLPNGVDVPAARRPVTPVAGERPFVLFVGRLSWEKGLDRLIPAMAGVSELDLVVAGAGEAAYRRALAELAERWGVSDRVHFIGAVDDTQRTELLSRALMLVLPSYSENFGVAAAEALAAACPVIVTKGVGLAAAVRASGAGLVVEGRPESLAEAMCWLADNPTRASKMGESGRVYAQQHFAWSTIAEQAESLYRECIGGPEAE